MPQWKEQFNVRKKTGRGMIFLYVLIALFLIMLPQMSAWIFPGNKITVLLETVKKEQHQDQKQAKKRNQLTPPQCISINEVTKESLIAMGLDSAVAEHWVNYRKAINGFESIAAVGRVYGLSDELFEELRPYLSFQESSMAESHKPGDNSTRIQRKSLANLDDKTQTIQWHPFDPNSIRWEGLVALGLDGKTASIWINYREAIGGFQTLEQIADVYGLSGGWFAEAKSYIQLPEGIRSQPRGEQLNTNNGSQNNNTSIPRLVDINEASAITWDSFPEIDAEVAERIVKYRHSIGGFKSVEDLKAVYGLDDGFIEQYSDRLSIAVKGSKERKKGYISITIGFLNTASEEELAAHSMVSRQQARLIVQYREQHGNFSSIQGLRRIRPLSASWIEKIAAQSKIVGKTVMAATE